MDPNMGLGGTHTPTSTCHPAATKARHGTTGPRGQLWGQTLVLLWVPPPPTHPGLGVGVHGVTQRGHSAIVGGGHTHTQEAFPSSTQPQTLPTDTNLIKNHSTPHTPHPTTTPEAFSGDPRGTATPSPTAPRVAAGHPLGVPPPKPPAPKSPPGPYRGLCGGGRGSRPAGGRLAWARLGSGSAPDRLREAAGPRRPPLSSPRPARLGPAALPGVVVREARAGPQSAALLRFGH